MGRRRTLRQYQPDGEARQVRYEMKLTVGEKEALVEKAAELGVSLPRLLVESALGDVMTRGERAALVGQLDVANRLLANLTGNMNQIAYQANVAGQITAAGEVEAALARVEEQRLRVLEVLERVK
jgi:hypothetical protein